VALLRLDAVSQSYWRGSHEIAALRDVSLEVDPGEVFAVYGSRNAGKTTLLRIAAGFEPPDSGKVSFLGKDFSSLSRRQLARLHREQIGWVERAGPHSTDLPIRDYLALPLYRELGRREAHRRAVAALERVGAADCAAESWDDLSDSVRVLIAIAHALAREPRLLIIDDPTAGLGVIDRERILVLVRSAAEDGGLGVLIAVPDLPAMLHASQIRSLSRGRLIGPATADEGGGGSVVEFPQHRRKPSSG
jgi:ABC-type multidrug transport system ATPase subunit